MRLGNWLTAEEARRFWQAPTENTLKGIRDRAILAISLGCGLRRRELADLEFRALAATRGTLGHCRSCGERRPHQDGTASRLGQDSHRCLDIVGRHLSWKAISLRLSSRRVLGRWRDRTCCVARGERVREETRLRDARSSRPSPLMREALSRQRWRIGADPIPSRTCVCSNYRAIPRM